MRKKYNLVNNLKFMIKEHWIFDKRFLILLLCQIPFHIGASFLTLIISKVVLDGLVSHESLRLLLIQTAMLAGVIVVCKVLDLKIGIKLDELSWKFFYYYGYEKINSKRMDMDYELYTSTTGKIAAQKALNAVGDYTFSSIVAFLINIKNCIMSFCGFLTFSAILTTLHPFILVLMILTYMANAGVILMIEKQKAKLHDSQSDINIRKRFFAQKSVLTEYAKDIRIYSLAGWLKAMQKELTTKELRVNGTKERYSFVQLIVQGMLTMMRDGIAYFYLIYCMLNDSNISIGLFSLYLGTIASFGDWLSELIDNIKEVAEANGYVKDFRCFMDLDKVDEKDLREVMTSISAKHIRLEKVSFSYPGSDKMVLKDISLDISPGENLALVGINGAGKTTLIKLICGLLHPTSGEIYIDGLKVSSTILGSRNQLFSAVFQDAMLIPASVAENVAFQHEITEEERNRIRDCLEKAGIYGKIKMLPKEIDTLLLSQYSKEAVSFSGGEVQKLLLARALYRDAPILILDEPTSALDPISERELYKKYRELMNDKTSIFISHRMGSTLFCDRIAVLNDGEIVEIGTHEELMNKEGWYKRMYDLSIQYYKEGEEKNV